MNFYGLRPPGKNIFSKISSVKHSANDLSRGERLKNTIFFVNGLLVVENEILKDHHKKNRNMRKGTFSDYQLAGNSELL